MAIAFVFPGQGSQAVGMGAELAKALCRRPAPCSTRSMPRSARSCPHIMCEGPLGDPHADRECPARADGRVAGGDARAGDREGLPARGQGEVRRRPFAGRIFGACRGRAHSARRCRAAAEDARPGHAGGRAGRAGRHGGAAGRRQGRAAEKLAAEAAQGEVCQLANDNEPTQAVHLRRQERRSTACAELAKAHGVRRCHAAQRQRSLPLRADAARRRRHGRGAGARSTIKAPVGAGGRQRAGGADLRSRPRSGSASSSR